MHTKLKSNLVVTLLFALAMSFGTTMGVLATLALSPRAAGPIHELPLYATATDHGETIAIATGSVGGGMEGLFILDYEMGRLTVEVLNQKEKGQVGGRFVRNAVHKDLEMEGERHSYLMVTGRATFIAGRITEAEPADSVVYVMDQDSGRWIAYGFLWSSATSRAGRPQVGELLPLYRGNARPEVAE